MINQASEALEAMRAQTTTLLSSIEVWRARADDPGHFRHRLLRAHVLALLDEIEQLGSTGAPQTHASP